MKFLVFLLFMLSIYLPCQAQNSRETIHSSMHPIFVAAGEDAGLCTAYAVGPRTIAIAEHCLGDKPKELETILFIVDYKDGNGQFATNADVVLDGNDHALVVLEDVGLDGSKEFKGFTTWVHDAFPAHTPRQGERVVMWGAPMAIQCRDCYREGYFSGWARSDFRDIMWFQIYGEPGDSGSFIFTEDGRLVAELSVGLPGFVGCLGFGFTAADVQRIK